MRVKIEKTCPLIQQHIKLLEGNLSLDGKKYQQNLLMGKINHIHCEIKTQSFNLWNWIELLLYLGIILWCRTLSFSNISILFYHHKHMQTYHPSNILSHDWCFPAETGEYRSDIPTISKPCMCMLRKIFEG